MAGLEIRSFFISMAHVRFASSFVCDSGKNLRFFKNDPIPTGRNGSFGIPEVEIILEGGREDLDVFNDQIAKNA